MRKLPTLTALLAAAGLAVLAPRPAVAQKANASAKGKAAASANVSKKELKEFAAAYPQIRAEATKMKARLAAAKTAKQKQAIQTQANQNMIAALKKNGLSAQDYARILKAVNTNSDLRQQFAILVQQQKDSAGHSH